MCNNLLKLDITQTSRSIRTYSITHQWLRQMCMYPWICAKCVTSTWLGYRQHFHLMSNLSSHNITTILWTHLQRISTHTIYSTFEIEVIHREKEKHTHTNKSSKNMAAQLSALYTTMHITHNYRFMRKARALNFTCENGIRSMLEEKQRRRESMLWSLNMLRSLTCFSYHIL